MDTPIKTKKTSLVRRLLSALPRAWDERMQVEAPDTEPTVWFPQDLPAELVRDPFRDAPTSEMRWAMTRCTGHGGVTSVRYCEHASCVAAMAAREVARLEQMGDAA